MNRVETTVAPRIAFEDRLLSLDVFRGATIAAMLLVNHPGSWSHVYAPLRHAPWHGWTPTDLIFPFFLFVVGITTSLSIESRRERGVPQRDLAFRIVRRGALILFLGLFLNAFPFYTWGSMPGVEDPSLLDRLQDRFDHMRFPGVLQRIGLAYIVGGLLVLRTPGRRVLGVVITTLLLGYWTLMTLVPVPGTGTIGARLLDEPDMVLSAWIDRQIFGDHLWVQSRTWDPEGLLSTIPAIATLLLGVMAGRILRETGPLEQRLRQLFLLGSVWTATGLAWSLVFPINKNLWTSSYTLFTAGIAMLSISAVGWVVDVARSRWWTPPLVAFGINPILAFVGSGLMARLIYSLIKVDRGEAVVPVQAAIHGTMFESWLPPRLASLAFAVTFVLLWLAILWPLYRRRIVWRV